MQIFVINLEKDRARRELVTKQLTEVGLPFEIFPGIYGKNLTSDELTACYSEPAARRSQGRSLTFAEIGCALSHVEVYREIVRRDAPWALVLEDDVLLGGLHADTLRALALAVPDRPAVILLSPAESKPPYQELGNGLRVGTFAAGYYTHAYIVTQLGARALLKALYPIGDVADCWTRLARHRVVDIFALSPPLILQNQTELGSSTTVEIQELLKNAPPLEKLLFKPRRAFWRSVDLITAAYDRLLNPYAGVVAETRQKLTE